MFTCAHATLSVCAQHYRVRSLLLSFLVFTHATLSVCGQHYRVHSLLSFLVFTCARATLSVYEQRSLLSFLDLQRSNSSDAPQALLPTESSAGPIIVSF